AAGVAIPGGSACVQNGQRRLHDLLETFCPVEFQQRDDRIDGAGHGGGLDVTVTGNAVFHIPRDGFGVARGFSDSFDQLHVFLFFVVDENGNFSANAERAYISYGERQQRGGACIGGGSALFQNLDAGRGGGGPAGNNHALATGGDTRSMMGERRFGGLG